MNNDVVSCETQVSNNRSRSCRRFLIRNAVAATFAVSAVFVAEATETGARVTDGFADATFGTSTNGLVITAIGDSSDAAVDVAVQSDGRIVVVGTDGQTNKPFVARYTTAGALDPTFDGDGKVLLTVPGSSQGAGTAVALNASGEIVVAGYAQFSSNLDRVFVARLSSTGALDPSFSTDGYDVVDIGASHDRAVDVAVRSDGKVVVAASVYVGEDTDNIGFVRYLADGSRDPAFGTAGVVNHDVTSDPAEVAAMALQSDGKIVVTGSLVTPQRRWATWRFTEAGSADSTFSGDGMITENATSGPEEGTSVALQSDGKVVVAGKSDQMMTYDFVLVRYEVNGERDWDFGVDGVVHLAGFGIFGAEDVLVQGDGKIVTVGSVAEGTSWQGVAVRLTTSGALDSGFGVDGKVAMGRSTLDEAFYGVAQQPDGKLIVVGSAHDGTRSRTLVGRVGIGAPLASLALSSGTLTPGFSPLVTEYTAQVDAAVSSVDITPVVRDTGATVSVGGAAVASGASAATSLAVGENSVSVVVTSTDGSITATYTVKITRATPSVEAAKSSTSSLAALGVSSGVLSPAFGAATTGYTVKVPNTVRTLTVTPQATSAQARVTVNGVVSVSGSASQAIALVVGRTDISVVVTAEDGVSTTTYTVSVERSLGTLKRGKSMKAKAILSTVDRTLPKGARVVLKAAGTSKKSCVVTGGAVKATAAGRCVVNVSYTPKATSKDKRPKIVRTKVTLIVT